VKEVFGFNTVTQRFQKIDGELTSISASADVFGSVWGVDFARNSMAVRLNRCSQRFDGFGQEVVGGIVAGADGSVWGLQAGV
jgi:hypothetical protein